MDNNLPKLSFSLNLFTEQRNTLCCNWIQSNVQNIIVRYKNARLEVNFVIMFFSMLLKRVWNFVNIGVETYVGPVYTNRLFHTCLKAVT